MESKSVVVMGYCVTQTPNGLLFVPFGVTVYRCNPSRVWSGWPILCLCFETHVLCFIPDVRASSVMCVFTAVWYEEQALISTVKGTSLCLMRSRVWISLTLKPAVGLSNMCDGVYRRFGSWDSRSEAFLEEQKHYCLSWASRLGGRNVHLDQENVLMAKARLNLV